MERFIWERQSVRPFYVFEGKYIVSFWDDGIKISHASKKYDVEIPGVSPLSSPHVYPTTFSLETYRTLVLNQRLPINIEMESENLGQVKLTSGYSEADLGAYSRSIIKQSFSLKLSKEHLTFIFYLMTTPVDPDSVHATLSENDKKAQEFNFEFPFPVDIVPEILNLTIRECEEFKKLVSTYES